MRAVSFASVFFAGKENEDVITILACKIRVTCLTTENEPETDLTCRKEKFIV